MSNKNLLKNLTRSKKEVYYPLYTIFISFFLYWVISLFIEKADHLKILPFLFFTLDFIFFRYLIDGFRKFIRRKKSEINKELNTYKKIQQVSIRLILILSLISFSLLILALLTSILLLLEDLYYIISILLHSLAILLIYLILHWEVKKYFIIKNRDNKNSEKMVI